MFPSWVQGGHTYSGRSAVGLRGQGFRVQSYFVSLSDIGDGSGGGAAEEEEEEEEEGGRRRRGPMEATCL